MKDIVILGSSGCAKDVLWLLEENNRVLPEWNILGLIDGKTVGQEVWGYPVLGDDQWLQRYPHPINAVCAFGSSALRRRVVESFRCATDTVRFPNIISCHALVSPHAEMGVGNIICARTTVTSDCKLSNFITINVGSTLFHDDVIGDFTTLNPGSVVCGNVTIGEGCEIGTGTHIIQGVHIGPYTVTGAGSAIIRDTPGYCTVVGVPGRILEK